MKTQAVSILLGLACAFAVSACSPKEDTKPVAPSAGTQDGGGGNIENSSEDEIRSAVFQALRMIDRPQTIEIIFSGAYPEGVNEEDKKALAKLRLALLYPDLPERKIRFENKRWKELEIKRFFEKLTEQDREEQRQIDAQYPAKYRKISDYAAPEKIHFEMNGACLAPDKDNADASVTSFDQNASICFSVALLKRIPKDALLQHVTALWIHELSHMHGFDERIAQFAEVVTIRNFRELVLSSTHDLPIRLLLVMRDGVTMMWQAFGFLKVEPKTENLRSIPAFLTQPIVRDLLKARVQMARAHGFLSSTKTVFDDTTSLRPVFRDAKIEKLQAELLAKLTSAILVTERGSQASDEQLLSEDFTIEFEVALFDVHGALTNFAKSLRTSEDESVQAPSTKKEPAK